MLMGWGYHFGIAKIPNLYFPSSKSLPSRIVAFRPGGRKTMRRTEEFSPPRSLRTVERDFVAGAQYFKLSAIIPLRAVLRSLATARGRYFLLRAA